MKVLVVGGYTLTLKWHRMDMMHFFLEKGCDVIALGDAPESEWALYFAERGIRYRSYYTDRNGTNPIHDLKTSQDLVRIFREERPDKVFVYHTKPNVYGSLAARACGIDELYAMVGGIGSVFISKGIKAAAVRLILIRELRAGLNCARRVFVQNHDDAALLVDRNILDASKIVFTNGSGVNIEEFVPSPIPKKPLFLFVGRMIRDKGVVEFLKAAQINRKRGSTAEYHMVGALDSNPSSLSEDDLREYIDDGSVVWHGSTDDVKPYLSKCSVFVLPSYREGTSKAALEAMACGRPIITTNVPGCREVVRESYGNGILVPPKEPYALADAMEALACDYVRVCEMGAASRRLAEEVFDVRKVNETIADVMGIA